MVGTSVMRTWWAGYRCLNLKSPTLRKDLTLFGRNAGYCALPMEDAFLALEQALVFTGYTGVETAWIPRNCPTGIGGGTCKPDGTGCTLHNYGVAIDIDPFAQGNPHFQTPYGSGWDFDDCKITRPQVDAVEQIKNIHGEQMFRWLGWPIGDTMHFEGQVKPTRCEVDWKTVPELEDEMSLLPLTPQSSGDDINMLKDLLNEGYGITPPLVQNGKWDDPLIAQVKEKLAPMTGASNPEIKAGRWVNANMFTGLQRVWVKSFAGTQGDKGDKGEQGDKGDQGPKGDPGIPGLGLVPGQEIRSVVK